MFIDPQIQLERLERYDDASIRILFEQYYIPLVLFANSYVGDQEIAKDTVQDIFYTLIENRKRFESIENLKIYLYSSVKNKCLKQIRHEEVKKRYQTYILHNQTEEKNYENRILEEEIYTLLNQAIMELPEQCKKVFLLALEGKNNTEIADILHISIETVKSHKKNGKKILYTKLKGSVSVFMPGIYFLLSKLIGN